MIDPMPMRMQKATQGMLAMRMQRATRFAVRVPAAWLRKHSWLTERLQDPPLPRLPSAYKIYPHTRQEDDRVACHVHQRLDEFGFCISHPSVWGESKTADEDDTDLRTSSSGSQTTSALLMCASLACGMGGYAHRQQS